MLTAAHASCECDGRKGRSDNATAAGGAEDHCGKRLSASAGGFREVVARHADDRADGAAALEAAGQDVGGEDGEGEGLIFSVGSVGPEAGHFGKESDPWTKNRGCYMEFCFLSFVFSRADVPLPVV